MQSGHLIDSQSALASLIEVSEVALRNWETDQSKPKAKNVQRAFYTVDMAQLHARKGEVESACDHSRQIIPKSRPRERLTLNASLPYYNPPSILACNHSSIPGQSVVQC